MSRLPRVPAPSLRATLRRAHLGFALGAVALVSVVLAGPGLGMLQYYAGHDVQLVGRAIGYSLEAAVVFGDTDAATSELQAIVVSEDIQAVAVTGRNGAVVAQWNAPQDGWRGKLGSALARLLHDGPVTVPILHDGAVAGHVAISGGARMLLPFLAYGLMGTLLCQLVVVAGALVMSTWIQRLIAAPLGALADVAGRVQRDRAFDRRVPRTGFRELNDLGDSFNGLLAELQNWHEGVTGENERLSYQATHDSLTGLGNRANFEACLHRAVEDARATNGTVAVMILDCNRFKQINDTYGHAAGDAVLVGVAVRLRSLMRKSDLIARLGGDEFAVLFAPSPPAGVLTDLIEALDDAMRGSIALDGGQTVTVGVSAGLARYPHDADDIPNLLRMADLAMYRDKRAQRSL